MLHGKKSISEKLLYGALDKIHDKTGQESIKVFKDALENNLEMVKKHNGLFEKDKLEWILNERAMTYGNGEHPKHKLIRYHYFFSDRIKNGQNVIMIQTQKIKLSGLKL